MHGILLLRRYLQTAGREAKKPRDKSDRDVGFSELWLDVNRERSEARRGEVFSSSHSSSESDNLSRKE